MVLSIVLFEVEKNMKMKMFDFSTHMCMSVLSAAYV